MPVLYGVLLYMGVASLKGMQFIERLGLFFMPPKYQPDYNYLRHVPLKQVHLFTFIQVSYFLFLLNIYIFVLAYNNKCIFSHTGFGSRNFMGTEIDKSFSWFSTYGPWISRV